MRNSKTRIEHEDAKLSNDPLKLEYEDCLRNQRGLSELTIYHCWRFADRFLQFRFGGKTRDLHKIAPTDIVRFMQHLVAWGKPFRDKTPPWPAWHPPRRVRGGSTQLPLIALIIPHGNVGLVAFTRESRSARHNTWFGIMTLGLNRFAVATRGKFWCHPMIFLQFS